MALKNSRTPYQPSFHQRYPDKPAFKERRYNRKKQMDKQENIPKKGKTPTKSARSRFTMEAKQKILMVHGSRCFLCESHFDLEFHHVKFQSKKGRGTWRNGVPLCHTCHLFVHEESPVGKTLAQFIRSYFLGLYGVYYYMDSYDLYKLGFISSPTNVLYERFMENQELLARTKNIS